MMHLYPKIDLQSGVSLTGNAITIHQYVAVYPFDYVRAPGREPFWFQYHQGSWTRLASGQTPSVWDSNVDVCTMDPITAVILKLVTAEEIKMPAGVEGLLALLR